MTSRELLNLKFKNSKFKNKITCASCLKTNHTDPGAFAHHASSSPFIIIIVASSSTIPLIHHHQKQQQTPISPPLTPLLPPLRPSSAW